MQKDSLTQTSNQQIEVRNADIPVLADIRRLMQEVEKTENDLLWQRNRMQAIKSQRPGKIHGSRAPKGLDEAYAVISELEGELKGKCKAYTRQVRKSQRIIEDIESPTMQTFVKLKYVDDLSDAEIRKRLHMSRRGLERAKRCVEDAPCMAAVKWREKYIILAEDG